jgi:hypothetical protein
MADERLRLAGLVATKAIAKNVNLPVLVQLTRNATIYNAWQNEHWVLNGAAVRVSIVCFAATGQPVAHVCLDDNSVERINPNLTSGLDTTLVQKLVQNQGSVFIGVQQSGPLSVARHRAVTWLLMPRNPNGRPNSDILVPYASTEDIVGRPSAEYLIDFPAISTENEASAFEGPFEYLRQATYDPHRDGKLVSFVDYRKSTNGQNPMWWQASSPKPASHALSIGNR